MPRGKRLRPEGKPKLALSGYATRLPRLRGFTCFSVDALQRHWAARKPYLHGASPQVLRSTAT